MNIFLCGLSSPTEAAVRRAISEDDQGLFSAADASAVLGLKGAERPSVVVLGGESTLAVAASCRQLRASESGREAIILAVGIQRPDDIRVLIDAGADDVFFDSSAEEVLRDRLLVAQGMAARMHADSEAEHDREQIFRLATQLFCIAGFDGYFKMVNPGWTEILGWSSAELLSAPYIEFVHPDDREVTIGAANRLKTGEPVIGFTNRYRQKDGKYRWLEWQSGSVVERGLVYSAVRDITDARVTAVALRDLSESLATTLDSIGDAVIATDAAGAIVRMNPVAERLTGWTLAEAKRRPPADVLRIVNGESRLPVKSPIERALREGVVVKLPGDTILTRRDGTEIPIADSCASIRTGDGAISGAVLVFRDLTAQCAAEASHAQLQKQLVFADRMASVGTLAAGVAHEINNPLSYVSSNVDMAIEEVLSIGGASPSGRLRELQAMLHEAREGVARVTKIVRGLKSFSRVEEERRSVVDLVPVIELSVAMSFNEIRPRARLVKDYGRIPLVEVDDARLGQVFINLLVNAAQAFQNSNIEENEIRIVTSTDDEGRVVVEVRDTGPGIPPAVLGRIFDPFFTTKAIGVGTGLGLAISHNIVAAAGGELSVESEVGRGTTFRVVLPASRATTSSAPPPNPQMEAGPLPRATILVVDDEPALGSTIRRVLRHHNVTAVVTAQDALALIAAGNKFDVVLSDLMMPGMSGMEFHAELVRLHPEVARRVVFLTGGAFTPDAKAFLDRVPNERMEKPFETNALRRMIQKVSKNAGRPLDSSASWPAVLRRQR
jgi:PAS domain S-box-containing protein